MEKPIILTGLRANNDLTLGNYFGGMLPMIDMAETRSSEFQINMFIPDLHSFTTPIDHTQLHDQILHNARLFVAAGLPLDNENIHLYRQSYVPAHSELTWILDCFTGFGEMSRMTQFKDKSSGKQLGETLRDKLNMQPSVSVGLFNYPVLMAADILLYGAKYVPVGDDQTQHLEFTRDIAERMNTRFGDLFVVPDAVKKQHEFFGKDQGLRIMDLADSTKKMSKSDESGKGVIFLGDDPENAAKKIMSATTDDKAQVAYDPLEQPGISNLIEILALLRNQTVYEVAAEFANETRYGEFKKVVAEELKVFLTEFQARLANVDDVAVLSKLEASEAAMNEQANARLYKVQQAVGLRPKA
jgi:tryptophanyl-tRNA synthetase